MVGWCGDSGVVWCSGGGVVGYCGDGGGSSNGFVTSKCCNLLLFDVVLGGKLSDLFATSHFPLSVVVVLLL